MTLYYVLSTTKPNEYSCRIHVGFNYHFYTLVSIASVGSRALNLLLFR